MNKKTRFWEMLSNQKIIIPKIQRDYAQGRKGKEYIRRSFLLQIKNALEKSEELTLDFIYGNIEENSFRPLDGQQRITTLWLLCWYLIFKSGELKNEKNILKNFSYNTRNSTTLFCENLCEKMSLEEFEQSKEKSVAEYIKSQPWFYSDQMQDPTISSMLRTISGNDITHDDNIQGVFKCIANEKDSAKKYADLLKKKVAFYQLNIGNEELPVSDDLYIKMNARGKALTDFENFKADLIGWFRSEENKDDFEQEKAADCSWEMFFTNQIDNGWTDMFWKHAKDTLGNKFLGKIDDIYFTFFNRYVANLFCIDSTKSPEFDNNFNHVFGAGLGKRSGADDRKVKYEGFESYKEYITLENLKKLHDIIIRYKDNEDDIKSVLSQITPENQEEDNESSVRISFIPQYENIDKETYNLKKITLSERVYFHAICLYLTRISNYDNDKFAKWMRVSKNIIENAEISSVSAMITCLKKIDEIGNVIISESEKIYTILANIDFEPSKSNSSTPLELQIMEEIEKAKQICADVGWEKKIKEAEKECFFNGSIRFLYRNEKGKPDWANFDSKVDVSKKLFNGKIVSYETIEKFLKLYDRFEDIQNLYLFTTVGSHRRHKDWKKNILCCNDEEMMEKVHNLLIEKTSTNAKEKDYEEFLNEKIFKKILEQKENYKYRCREHNDGWAIHKEYSQYEGMLVGKVFCDYFKNLQKHSRSGKIQIDNEGPYDGYYWGMKIVFTYNNKKFSWKGSSQICELKEDKETTSKAWEKGEDLLVILNN